MVYIVHKERPFLRPKNIHVYEALARLLAHISKKCRCFLYEIYTKILFGYTPTKITGVKICLIIMLEKKYTLLPQFSLPRGRKV